MNERSDDLRQRKNAVKIDSDPVQILDETERKLLLHLFVSECALTMDNIE
jgi:hypothetical protein